MASEAEEQRKTRKQGCEALRDRRFAQGVGNYFSEGKYCALGVLMHVVDYVGIITVDRLAQAVGATVAQLSDIVDMNDGRRNDFDAIASAVQRWR